MPQIVAQVTEGTRGAVGRRRMAQLPLSRGGVRPGARMAAGKDHSARPDIGLALVVGGGPLVHRAALLDVLGAGEDVVR